MEADRCDERANTVAVENPFMPLLLFSLLVEARQTVLKLGSSTKLNLNLIEIKKEIVLTF